MSGKIYSIDDVIEEVANNPVTPAMKGRIFSTILFSILFAVLSFRGGRLGGVGAEGISAGRKAIVALSGPAFGLPNQAVLVSFLRELWDKAWEIQASRAEVIFVVGVYAMLVFICTQTPAVRALLSEILKIAGL